MSSVLYQVKQDVGKILGKLESMEEKHELVFRKLSDQNERITKIELTRAMLDGEAQALLKQQQRRQNRFNMLITVLSGSGFITAVSTWLA